MTFPVDINTLANSIGFTKGPVWLTSAELLVTSVSRGLVYRVSIEGGGAEVAAETGGGPNGLAVGPDGVIYVAQNGSVNFQSRSPRSVRPGIQAIRAGEVEDLVVEGCSAPSDLVLGPDARLWFTDPGQPEPSVRALDLRTGQLSTVITGIAFPNGLAFNAAGPELYVADSETGDILRLEVADGAAGDAAVFANIPSSSPDGIAFDKEGNLFVAGFATDEVVVLGPSGEQVATMPTGAASRPTNLCFAGPNLSRLVVTAASGGKVLLRKGTTRAGQCRHSSDQTLRGWIRNSLDFSIATMACSANRFRQTYKP